MLRARCACDPQPAAEPYSFVVEPTKEALVSSLKLGRWVAIGAVIAVAAIGIVLLVVFGGGSSGAGY